MDTPIPNAADPEHVKRAGRRARRVDERRFNLVAQQMATPEGREFVWQELERREIFHSVDAIGSDVMAVGMFLGKRETGLKLFVEIKGLHADSYLLMQSEAIARAKRDAAEQQAAQQGRKPAPGDDE